MNQAFNLFCLQKIDSSLDQANSRLAEIDHILSSDTTLIEAQTRQSEKKQALEMSRQKLRAAEHSVQEVRIKIELAESSLYGGKVKNPKELQDLQKDIEANKRHLNTLEDRQLDAMIQTEEAESQLQAADRAYAEAQATFATRSASLLGEKSSIEHTRERLLEEKRAAMEAVQPDSLNLYLSLRKQKRGLAVAQVEDKSCSICGSDLTPAEWQTARSPSAIAICKSCGRILYAG